MSLLLSDTEERGETGDAYEPYDQPSPPVAGRPSCNLLEPSFSLAAEPVLHSCCGSEYGTTGRSPPAGMQTKRSPAACGRKRVSLSTPQNESLIGLSHLNNGDARSSERPKTAPSSHRVHAAGSSTSSLGARAISTISPSHRKQSGPDRLASRLQAPGPVETRRAQHWEWQQQPTPWERQYWPPQQWQQPPAPPLSSPLPQQPPREQAPSADEPPTLAHGRPTGRSDSTSRSHASQAAGKPTHRGELGGTRLRVQLRPHVDSGQVACALQDPSPDLGSVMPGQNGRLPQGTCRLQQQGAAAGVVPPADRTPYAAACARHCDATNPIVDPEYAASLSGPVTSTSRASYTAGRDDRQLWARPPAAGTKRRTSCGEDRLRPSGQTFVRAGQLAEAAGAASQGASWLAGVHSSAPYGVTPADTEAGRLSYRTSSSAGHGDPHCNESASLAGRIAQRRLQGRQRYGGETVTTNARMSEHV
jgi:hypothetical protein